MMRPMMMMSMAAAAVVLLLASIAQAKTVDLTEANFEDEIYKQPSMIMFFAPWCGYCKQVKPEWEKLTEAYANLDGVLIGSLDCDAHKAAGEKYGIKGFPTIKFFKGKDEEPIAYEGERDVAAFVDFVNKNTGLSVKVKKVEDPIRDLDSDSFRAALQTSNKNNFAVLYAAGCGHCKRLMPVLPKLAEAFVGDDTMEVVKIDAQKHSDIGAKYDIQGYPTLKLFLADGTEVPYDSSRDPQDILSFINKHVGTHRTLDGGFDTGAWPSDDLKQIVEKFHKAADAEKQRLLEQAEKAAKDAQGRFAKFAHFYPKLMKNAIAKPAFLDSEPSRLQNLLQNKMGDEPRLNALYRLTILKQLKGVTEPNIETSSDDDKDEL